MNDTYVLLNGAFVPPADINPTRHRYLGVFRPATNHLLSNSPAYVLCTCGVTLQTREAAIKHYHNGCLDVPQYIDIIPAPPFRGFVIMHADGKRWRTLDTIGMPDWTDDIEKALCLSLREHADACAEDDPEDVRIVEKT